MNRLFRLALFCIIVLAACMGVDWFAPQVRFICGDAALALKDTGCQAVEAVQEVQQGLPVEKAVKKVKRTAYKGTKRVVVRAYGGRLEAARNVKPALKRARLTVRSLRDYIRSFRSWLREWYDSIVDYVSSYFSWESTEPSAPPSVPVDS